MIVTKISLGELYLGFTDKCLQKKKLKPKVKNSQSSNLYHVLILDFLTDFFVEVLAKNSLTCGLNI